jgi:holo-ACP synthase/triphosphoribosyl-dephospho-CoA synthase
MNSDCAGLADSPAVSLEAVLAFREERARRQKALTGEYGLPLVCLSLNIPGEHKAFPLAKRCFQEELRSFTRILGAEEIAVAYRETVEEDCGYTAYVCVNAEAERIKSLARNIEETHILGRLFDIDVYTAEAAKLSRGAENPRPCLVCGGNGFACARSRAHTTETVLDAMLAIMENFLKESLQTRVSSAVVRALIGEVAVTPKPGLVDRANNGSHRDMDFFSFIDSTAAILPFFRECAVAGFERRVKPGELFDSLRLGGKIAELDMGEASGGANTHRGLIFSLGVLSAAYGSLYRQEPGLDALLEQCRAMTSRLAEDFSHAGLSLSHGGKIYSRLGMSGIRGEVSAGFPTVHAHSLPVLKKMLEAGHSMNDAGIAAFLSLLAHTDDTNIVHRAGKAALERIREDAASFLSSEPGMEAMRGKAVALDREFIEKNISPGGCADLLAVTFFLYQLERAAWRHSWDLP